MNGSKIILSVIIVFLFYQIITAQSNYHALCVGIWDYPGDDNDLLVNNENDANDMRVYLVTYQGWSYNNIEVKLNSYATAEAITNYISSMPNTRGTTELFTYGGHGNTNGLSTYSGTISPQQLQSSFGSNFYQFGAFIKCCNSGVFANQMTRGEISTTCAADEESFSEGPDNNSAYFYYVLEGIKNNQADPTAGHIVSVKDVHNYAHDPVYNWILNNLAYIITPQFKSNLGVLNLYPKGPTLSGTLVDDELWDQDITLNDDVIVPSGKILAFSPGITINFNGNAILFTGGTLVDNGAIGIRATLKQNSVLKGIYGSIQTATTYADNDNEIVLQNGNFNENVSISNKSDLTILGGSSNFTHFGTLTLTNCDYFYGYNFGAKSVYLNQADYAMINNIDAYGTDQSTIGFYLYNSDATANNILAANSQAGVSCYDGSEADIDESWLYDNLRGIDSYNGSNVNINDTYFCGTALDLKTYNSSSIYATSCYFDGGTPSVSGSNIYHYGNQSCPLSKVNTNQQIENNNYLISTGEDKPANSEFERINSTYFAINKKLINAFKAKTAFDKESYCTEYEEVIRDYKNFIDTHPNSPLLKIALIASAHSYRRIDELRGKSDAADMKNFLKDFIEKKEYSELKPTAERLMVDYYRKTKDFNNAISLANELIEVNKENDNYVCDILYAKGLMYSYDINEREKAAECFSSIINNYPQETIVELARNELRILGKEPEYKEEQKLASLNEEELSGSNYPNPFNPSTKISYTLPEDGRVSIKIFDVLGREVANLINGIENKGKHSVVWDGSNVSSGIYFYTISFKNQTINKKMLLMK